MFRRSVALALVLSIAAFVPLPTEACAMLSGLHGSCQCPMIDCAQMPMPKLMSRIGPAIFCYCVQSSAPYPSAVQETASPAPAFAVVSYAQPIQPTSPVEFANLHGALAASQLGPPGGRLGLHLLLI